MSILFEPRKIKDMALRNRFVRSATYDGSADKKGYASDNQIRLFTELAEAGVGLIVTGITYVHRSGQISSFQNGITGDEAIPSFRRLTEALHERGAKIAVQLFHAGRERGKFIKSKEDKAIAPSYVENDAYFSGEYRAITEDEIWEVIRAFGDAAKRAREAGFDAVQVHAAHAYLLSQFLSPYTNRRDDDWGGTLEGRLRLHREICREIRAKVGTRGQVVIPRPIREMFQIHAGESMYFRVENNEIMIRKEEGEKILNRLLSIFEEKMPEPEKMEWKGLYYSQFEEDDEP